MQPPKSVCILRLSALGDICHTVPILNTLRHEWPDTRFTWIVGSLEAKLLDGLPGVELVVFDKGKGWRAYNRLRHDIGDRRFSILLHMQMALRASIASLFIHAPIRVGFDRKRAHDMQWLFTTKQIPFIDRQHVMDSLFGFTSALGIESRILNWEIPIPASAQRKIQQAIPDSKPLVVISPCASPRFRNWRDWPYARYSEVIRAAIKTLGWQVAISGGSSQEEALAASEIVASVPELKVVNLQGQLTIKELLALIDRARLLISPDSGPVHIATAVRTPVIGLYATTNPDRAGPYFSQQWRIDRYPDAVRTFLGKSVEEVRWGTRVRHPEAMKLIQTEEVVRMLLSFAATQCQR